MYRIVDTTGIKWTIECVNEIIASEKKQLEARDNRIDELTTENRQLKYDNAANRLTIARQKANNDKLKDKHMEELYEMYDLDRKEIDVLKSKNIELKNSLAASRATYRSAVVTIDEQKTFINRLLYSNKEFNAVLDNVRKELSGAKKHIADKDMLIECIETDLIKMIKRNTPLKDQYILDQKTIEKLEATIGELYEIIHDFRVGYGASRMFVDAVLIRNLRGDITELKVRNDDLIKQYLLDQKTIEKLDNKIVVMRNEYGIEQATDHDAIRTLNQHIISLESELSAYKQDSEVLKKVVEIVDMWDTYPVGKEMHKIYALVEDYLDVACEGCGKRCTLEELTDGRCHECVLPDGHQTHVYIGR